MNVFSIFTSITVYAKRHEKLKTHFAPSLRRYISTLLLVAGMVFNNADAAADTDTDTDAGARMFEISGFATLGATHSSNDNADYTVTYYQPNGAGHSRRYDFVDETRIGVQLSTQFTKQLSAVVQIVAEQRYDNRFTPAVEWANVRYAFTPDISMRIGRIELPTYFNSDVRNVGLANPWLHPPAEVYSINPVTSSDGVDISYRLHANDVSNTLRLLYGNTAFHLEPGAIRMRAADILGLFDTIDYYDVTARIGIERTRVSLSFLPSLPVTLYTVGVLYDPGSAFVQAELVRLRADTLAPGYISAYVTLGYRIRKFTPYVTFAREFSTSHPVLIENANNGQSTLSVGTRWDVANNVDLKVQFDHVSMPAGSNGLLIQKSTTYQLGSGTNVLSICLDLTF